MLSIIRAAKPAEKSPHQDGASRGTAARAGLGTAAGPGTGTGVAIRVGFSIEELHEVTEEDQDDPRRRIPMFLDILATRRPRDKKMALA